MALATCSGVSVSIAIFLRPLDTKLSETNYKDGKKEGLYKSYHGKDKLEQSGNYKDGQRVGYWEFYHNNSQLSSKGNFKDGKQVGLWKFYYESGKIKSEENFKLQRHNKKMTHPGIEII